MGELMGNEGHITVWSADRDEYLATRFNAGATTIQLIEGLKESFGVKVTRNAISVRVRRLRQMPGVITRSPVPINTMSNEARKENIRLRSRERKQKQRAALRVTPGPSLAQAIQAPVDDIIPLHVTLASLERGCCAYPYGSGAGVTFCGHPAEHGHSYCVGHQARCYKAYTPDPAITAQRQRMAFSGGGGAGHVPAAFYGRGSGVGIE